jgi:hypothetical protein
MAGRRIRWTSVYVLISILRKQQLAASASGRFSVTVAGYCTGRMTGQ